MFSIHYLPKYKENLYSCKRSCYIKNTPNKHKPVTTQKRKRGQTGRMWKEIEFFAPVPIRPEKSLHDHGFLPAQNSLDLDSVLQHQQRQRGRQQTIWSVSRTQLKPRDRYLQLLMRFPCHPGDIKLRNWVCISSYFQCLSTLQVVQHVITVWSLISNYRVLLQSSVLYFSPYSTDTHTKSVNPFMLMASLYGLFIFAPPPPQIKHIRGGS